MEENIPGLQFQRRSEIEQLLLRLAGEIDMAHQMLAGNGIDAAVIGSGVIQVDIRGKVWDGEDGVTVRIAVRWVLVPEHGRAVVRQLHDQ